MALFLHCHCFLNFCNCGGFVQSGSLCGLKLVPAKRRRTPYQLLFSVIIPGLAHSNNAIQLGRLPDLLPRRHNRILLITAPLPLAAAAILQMVQQVREAGTG